VSLNTALAARVGAHRVTYQADPANPAAPLQLRVDGAVIPLTATGVNLSGGGRIAGTAGALEIDFPDGTVLIASPTWVAPQWALNISVHRTEADAGIMGAVPASSWLPALPRGASMGPMPATPQQRFVALNQTFANAWRITRETSLFDYARGTSTATFTNRAWPGDKGVCLIPNAPRPPKPLSAARARKICRSVVGKARNADCRFDVAVTGSPAFAKAYERSERIERSATVVDLDAGSGPVAAGLSFTATVSRLAGGGRVPTGTVQFVLDGEKSGGPVRLDNHGRAVWRGVRVKAGEHRLSARYSPDEASGLLPSGSMETVVALGTTAGVPTDPRRNW
jgi:hypothetical protein